jgi:hypothetical protein
VRQWSHIDGKDTYYQGNLLCGHGISLTLEFPVMDPPVSCIEDLETVWTFLPHDSCTFKAISQCIYSTELLQKYGTLFNHDAEHPINPPSFHKYMVTEMSNTRNKMKNWNSIYPGGTLI